MDWEHVWNVVKEVCAIILSYILKFLGLVWAGLKWLGAFLWKYGKIGYKKARKAIKKYIRMLVKHTKAGDYSILTYTIIGLLVLILLICLLVHGIAGKKKKKAKNTTEITTELSTTEAVDPQAMLREQAQYIYNSGSDYLMLVNDTNPIVAGYTFEQHTLNSGYIVDERIYPDLLEMLNACNAAGFEYTIKQGYIPAETEGSGEYATGLCFDVTAHDITTLDATVAELGTNKWLMENCTKYGFIVRYPNGKDAVTGKSFQPWHFRYVGRDAANFMYNNNLTLEEFYTLMNGGSVDVSAPAATTPQTVTDPNTADPNTTDPNTAVPNTADPNTTDPAAGVQ